MSVTPKALTNLLERWPVALHRAWHWETDIGKACGARKIDDTRRADLPAPQVPWHLTVGWDCELRKCSIPLRPSRLLGIRQVQTADNVPTLPATVAGRIGTEQRVTTVRCLAIPDAFNRNGINLRYVVGDSSSAEMSLATRR